MMFDLLPTVGGYVLALVMMVLAIVCWRKAIYLNTLLMENVNLQQEARRHLQRMESELKRSQEQLQETRQSLQRQERTAHDLRGRVMQESSRQEELLADAERIKQKERGRFENLSAQVAALTEQLTMADRERAAALAQVRNLETELERRGTQHAEQAQRQVREVQTELNKLQRQADEWRGKAERALADLAKIDLNEIRKIKKRNSHLEHLYQSMKGLREMAEERSENWEVALRKLSFWVLGTRSEVTANRLAEGPIGPLVGEALAAIGAELVDDSAEGPDTNMATSRDRDHPESTTTANV